MTTMRTGRLRAVLALSLLAAGSAMAQGPGGGFRGGGFPGGGPPGRGGGAGMLLNVPEVQTELKLTNDQKAKIADLGQQAQQAFQEIRQKLQDATPEERQQLFADLQKTMGEMQANQAKQLAAILTPVQQKRLK